MLNLNILIPLSRHSFFIAKPENSKLQTPHSELRAQEQTVVTQRVCDLLGREVTTLVNAQQRPGNYEVKWEATGQASGVNFYILIAGNYTDTKKMILLR